MTCSRRHMLATAATLAALALTSPHATARQLHEAGAAQSQGPISARTADSLTEEQVLASRGQGPPRPAVRTADGGVHEDAPGAWAIGAGTVTALFGLAAWALTTRRRAAA